jgi:quercetin dioxygenase-like cupin family protein
MKRMMAVVALSLAMSVLVIVQVPDRIAEGGSNNQQTGMSASDHGLFTPAEIRWTDAPASLPRGAKVAILEGNPSQQGPFTMRLQMPDGYRIPPHWHPAVEHVTVISGTFNLGMGDRFDASAVRAMPAGSFAFMPPGTRHFAMARGETVVQVHGVGPWQINYVNPRDDPRNRR